jgi:hypothetical protein
MIYHMTSCVPRTTQLIFIVRLLSKGDELELAIYLYMRYVARRFHITLVL